MGLGTGSKPTLPYRDSSDVWSEFSGYDMTPYPSIGKSSLASGSHSGKYSLTFEPKDWVAHDTDPYDPDDELIKKPIFCNPFSLRGLGNVASLSMLIGGLIGLFVAYPVVTAITRRPQSNLGGFNLGGVNSSGQIPSMLGNRGLIDKDTPKRAYTKPSWNDPSVEMELVFSDEFNMDGRSFYPGDDPYWEAADLHYWATGNLEWYDPEATTTRGGALWITLDSKPSHGLDYQGGLLSSWNKFCFTGGYIETSVVLPGANNILGLWPAIWTMGNLGRAGYGATLEGVWPYTYDSCDVGTVANQTIGGLPEAAASNGNGGPLSYLPGQRLSRCTCQGENHPGPNHPDGTFVGRSAPEIDVFEAQIDRNTLQPGVSQSAQWAPFDDGYQWDSTSQNMILANPSISVLNTFVGGLTQQSTSVITQTNPNCYEDNGGCFSVYGFEYKPGYDDAYIAWISNNQKAWTLHAGGVGANPTVQISARQISEEPMYMIMNLGMSRSFGPVDLADLPFPVHMKIDYVRVYQPTNAVNIGCDPKNYPTKKYIDQHIDAYTNPNITTWVDGYKQPWPKNSLVDQC